MHTVLVNKKWCKQCGICMTFCPRKVFETDEKGYPAATHSADCIACRLCEARCPDFAIKVIKEA